jgi:hypothetical protein
MQAQGVEQA